MQNLSNRWFNFTTHKSVILQGNQNNKNNNTAQHQLSLIISKHPHNTQKKSPNQLRLNQSGQLFGDNSTITSLCNNQLGKSNKVSRSVIRLGDSKGKSTTNSMSRRKKFISLTQKSTELRPIIPKQSPKNNKSQKKFTTHFTVSERKSNQKEQDSKNNFPSSLKEYLGGMIRKISSMNEKSLQDKEKYKNTQNENVLQEDLNISQKQFYQAQKAKEERNRINIFFERQKRSYTEISDSFQIQNHKTAAQYEYMNIHDSRNQIFFYDQKIGKHTLTRKNSPILSLTSLLQVQSTKKETTLQLVSNSQKVRQKSLSKINISSSSKMLPIQFHEIKSAQSQKKLPKKQQIQKINKDYKKIKFVSLIQKQQSYRYKINSKDNQLKQKFINLKNKSHRNKDSSNKLI